MRQGRARGRLPTESALHGAGQGGRGPARNLMCFCAIIQLRLVRVNRICIHFTHNEPRSCHVYSLPGAIAQLISKWPHIYACTPKLSSALLPKALAYPSTSPFDSRL
jgi:hypothetical protein